MKRADSNVSRQRLHLLPVFYILSSVRARGFTLIELLVTMGIAGTLAAALMVSLLIGRNTYLSSSASIDVQQEARRAFQVMVTELREGGNIYPATNAPPTPPANFTNATRINFQVARSYDTAACGGICWGSDVANGEWVHYFQLDNDDRLIRCRSGAAGTPIASSANCLGWRVLANKVRLIPPTNVPSFNASYANGTRTVTLALEIEEKSTQLPGGRMSSGTLQTTIKLRNP